MNGCLGYHENQKVIRSVQVPQPQGGISNHYSCFFTHTDRGHLYLRWFIIQALQDQKENRERKIKFQPQVLEVEEERRLEAAKSRNEIMEIQESYGCISCIYLIMLNTFDWKSN